MGMRPENDIVIGGGLGGLTCALQLARAGRRVTLFEKAASLGGRAATEDRDGVRFNFGPHALYLRGAARTALRELGVDPSGRRPPASGMLALDGGRLHALPAGFASLLTTSLLGVAEKVEAARILQGLARLDTGALRGRSVSEWIDGAARRPGTRRLLHAMVRVTCYANAPDLLAADAAVAQLDLGLTGGVMYVDGGWQTIVDALAARAEEAGVVIKTSSRVARVGPGRVTLADGSALYAANVIIAAAPAAAAALVPSSATLAAAAAAAVPVRAACLDVALAELPRPRALFCLGIDEPLYYSVHSASAALAPEPIQVIHVARYLAPDEQADASSLEALLDRLQPGWRERLVARRFLPRLTVVNDLHPIGRRRAAAEVADAPGVFAVGDWVGEGAMLTDSVLASATAATASILRQERPRARAAAGAAQAWS
jgi:phytoene dehydrogenase-like protein